MQAEPENTTRGYLRIRDSSYRQGLEALYHQDKVFERRDESGDSFINACNKMALNRGRMIFMSIVAYETT
jgi:hypothetical protein